MDKVGGAGAWGADAREVKEVEAAMRAMRPLIEQTIPALRRYARSLVNDTSAADDLVQDTLERMITRWHQRDTRADPRTWAFSILHNLAMSRLRQTARRGATLDVDGLDERLLAEPPRQEEALHHGDLLAALDALPDEQRAVILLVSVEDLSYADTAEVLGVPIGTVMSRLSRGRARLLRLTQGDASEGATREAASAPKLRRVK